MGNCPRLGSVWDSGQVWSSGYIVNNYRRSTFDLAVFGGKFNSSRRSQIAKRMASLRSFFCFLYDNTWPVKKLCRTKRNCRTNGYSEQRQLKYTHCEPRKLARFDATCIEFGTCPAAISAQLHKNVPARAARAAVSGFNFFFHPIGRTTLVVK